MDNTKGMHKIASALANIFPTFIAVLTSFATTFAADPIDFIGHGVLQTYIASRLGFCFRTLPVS